MPRKAKQGEQHAPDRPVNQGRHEYNCKVCKHPEREEIERAFSQWGSVTELAKEYGLTRDSLYRHAHALELFAQRGRNLYFALDRIIEKAGDVEVNANAVVAAIQARAKINSSGLWIDRKETVNLNELFNRMSTAELDAYAKNGTLPAWFPASAAPATEINSRSSQNEQ